MIKFEVLSLNNKKEKSDFEKCLKETGCKSPFQTIAFIKCFSNGTKDLICFKVKSNNRLILLLGYLKTIEGNSSLKDFRSPYGYSGPIYSNNVENSELENFWKEVNDWFKQNSVVASFIRFSLTNNSLGFNGTIIPTLLNIKGIIRSEEVQWKNFEPKVRKNVNKAKRERIKCEIVNGANVNTQQLKSFYKIYTTTLLRNSATKNHYASLNDFELYCRNEDPPCIFAFVYDNDKMIAAEMVLHSDNTIYSFLGGTAEKSFDKRPNDFLKYTLINWARSKEYKYFVLGGGFGKEDGIFKYKKSFFPNDIVPFYTGRQIFDPEKYRQLSDQVKQKLTTEEKEDLYSTDFFPAYRFSKKEI